MMLPLIPPHSSGDFEHRDRGTMTSAVIIYARGTRGRNRMGKEGERVLQSWRSLCFWKVDRTGSSASVSTAMAHMHQ